MPTAHAGLRWDTLPDELQLELAGQALLRAAEKSEAETKPRRRFLKRLFEKDG